LSDITKQSEKNGEQQAMLENYFPVLVFLIVSAFIGCAALALGFLLGTRRPDAEKNSVYECGFNPEGQAQMPFDVRFYLVAILFILFDLEMAFLVPWGVVIHKISWLGFFSMGIFLLLLLVGFIYEWKKGALEWE
jgi:NADH-quinone oxidoreductase subunit A